jgi:ketosteroid isomerase-like protein
MIGIRLVKAAAWLAACVGVIALAPRAAVAAAGNEAAEKEAWEFVDGGIHSFVAMDRAKYEASIADDISAFDLDVENNPVKMGSRADALAYFDAIVAEVKKMGATMKVATKSHRCEATPAMAFCTAEYDFIIAMPDGTSITQPSYFTAVIEKAPSGWKWAHWHTSLSVKPAQAAP